MAEVKTPVSVTQVTLNCETHIETIMELRPSLMPYLWECPICEAQTHTPTFYPYLIYTPIK